MSKWRREYEYYPFCRKLLASRPACGHTMKKRMLSILLCLCMVLMLEPTTVFAEEPTGTLAVTINGFQVGNTPGDIKLSIASTIPGVTFSADDINRLGWEYYDPDGNCYPFHDDQAFQAGTSYWCTIQLDNKGLKQAPAATVNGNTPGSCIIMFHNGELVGIGIGCDIGTPEPAPITLTVPFTTTVKKGGNTAPGKTKFELELVDNRGEKLSFDDVEVAGSVTTNGKGDYDGTLTLTGPERQLWYLLSKGAFVQQVNEGEENWKYDDTVWGLYLRNVAELANDAAPENTVLIFPATCKNTDDGGVYYNMVDRADPVERMTFTNIYTKNTARPSENGTNTGTVSSPQTGDNSSLTVWFALLAVLAAGVMGAGVYSNRRRSSR